MSDGVTVVVEVCNIAPPNVAPAAVACEAGGKSSLDILSLIDDLTSIDLRSLKITQPPGSGAKATIDANGKLELDYGGINFVGQEKLTIEVCNVNKVCVQQDILIDVGIVVAYNGISANGDSKNAILLLKYIDVLEDTKKNTVSIYNRWGDRVFQIDDYDNASRAFSGKNSNGEDLPVGTYFYKMEYATGRKTQTGYLSLKR